jgi:multiple sugar transport system substrate-binding protein
MTGEGGEGKVPAPDPGTPGPAGDAPPPRRRAILKAAVAAGGAAAVLAPAGAWAAGAFQRPDEVADDADDRMITWAASSIDYNPNDSRPVLIDAFERAHPTIKVRLLPGPSSTDAKRSAITEAIRTGTSAPDVYLGDVIWPAEFAHEKLARPLDHLFPAGFWKRFDRELVEAASYGGRVYSVPFYRNQGVLFYRKDLLDLLARRRPPGTWQELESVAAALQRRGLVKDGLVWQGASYEGLTCVWTEFVADAGGGILDPTATRSLINSPSALHALRFMRHLIDVGVTPRDVVLLQEPQATELFNGGTVAFMRGWNTADTTLAPPGVVGVSRLPTFAGRPPGGYSTVGGWNMFVSPRTRKLAAVTTFIDWMTSAPAQRILARHSQIPTNKDVNADRSVAPDNPVLAAARDSLPVARPSNTPLYPAVSRAVYTNINRALTTTEVPPERALADAHKQIEEIL